MLTFSSIKNKNDDKKPQKTKRFLSINVVFLPQAENATENFYGNILTMEYIFIELTCLLFPIPGDGDSQSQKDSDATLESDSASSDGDLPGLVIYMVDPFSFAQDWEDFNRLAMLGLLRCFHDMLRSLPEHLASNIQLQVKWYVMFECKLELILFH